MGPKGLLVRERLPFLYDAERSVGESGFSSLSPPEAVVSHGMWLCPKTSTSKLGNSLGRSGLRGPFAGPVS